jgi:hypothetical protein
MSFSKEDVRISKEDVFVVRFLEFHGFFIALNNLVTGTMEILTYYDRIYGKYF